MSFEPLNNRLTALEEEFNQMKYGKGQKPIREQLEALATSLLDMHKRLDKLEQKLNK